MMLGKPRKKEGWEPNSGLTGFKIAVRIVSQRGSIVPATGSCHISVTRQSQPHSGKRWINVTLFRAALQGCIVKGVHHNGKIRIGVGTIYVISSLGKGHLNESFTKHVLCKVRVVTNFVSGRLRCDWIHKNRLDVLSNTVFEFLKLTRK